MKETSGEFSMTVVVIVGAIIVVGLLTAMGPYMGNFIKESSFCKKHSQKCRKCVCIAGNNS